MQSKGAFNDVSHRADALSSMMVSYSVQSDLQIVCCALEIMTSLRSSGYVEYKRSCYRGSVFRNTACTWRFPMLLAQPFIPP